MCSKSKVDLTKRDWIKDAVETDRDVETTLRSYVPIFSVCLACGAKINVVGNDRLWVDVFVPNRLQVSLNDGDCALLLHDVDLGIYAEFEFKVSKAVTRCRSSEDKGE